MKSKSYFVDRIIKLRGEGDKDELMKLQMVDLLKMLNEERNKQAEPDDIVDMIPAEKDDEEEASPPAAEAEEAKEAPAPKKEEGEKQASPPESDSDDEGIVSIVKRFLFTPSHKD
jgi:hypothetical protein